VKSTKPPQSVDEYIAGFPEDLQKNLRGLRNVIKKAAPQAVEKISYGMPAYTFKGMLLYFAMHTSHIGLYPYPSAMEAFKKEVAEYRTSKGTLQFPHNKKLPLKLIAEIVKFRVRENIMKEELKTLKKRSKKQSG
jgi:uncharacterized protein YdhG (YjbR/CyaY superfamily)